MFIQVLNQNTFLIENPETYPAEFEVCPSHFSLLSLSRSNGDTFVSVGFQEVSNSACYMRKRPSERGKKRCVSHGEQLQKESRGEGGHLCRPKVFHTSWALALHPLYRCTSPFPVSLLQELHPLFLWQGLCTSCHIPLSLPYGSFHYSLSQHCLLRI